MNKIYIFLFVSVLLFSCHDPSDLNPLPIFDEVTVKPVFRQPTKGGENLTVFVFHERNRGKKPPKEDATCSDLNTNQLFAELGVVLPDNFMVEYHPVFEPAFAFDAIDRGFNAWKSAAGDIFDFAYNVDGVAPPQRDFVNVVGWRRFVGGSDFLAATFIWDDGFAILEADIFYNLRHKWKVNTVIEPGSTSCGSQFDIQGVGTHEVGHMLGLGHVPNSDATMAPTAAKGELEKQTLTPGDIIGSITVTQ